MKYTNQKQIRAAFWQAFPDLPRRKYLYSLKDNPHKAAELVYSIDTRCAFVDYVDSLNRAGVISDALAHRATL